MRKRKKSPEEKKKESDENVRKTAVTAIFLEAEEKVKREDLESFINKYTYYVNKLLWSTKDQFLKYKHRVYKSQCQRKELNRYKNVFNRLQFDNTVRKEKDEKLFEQMSKKYYDISSMGTMSPHT